MLSFTLHLYYLSIQITLVTRMFDRKVLCFVSKVLFMLISSYRIRRHHYAVSATHLDSLSRRLSRILLLLLSRVMIWTNIFTLTLICTPRPMYLPLLCSSQQSLLYLGDTVDNFHQLCTPTHLLLQRFQFPY